MSGRGGCGGVRGRIISSKGHGGRKNFNRNNNQNKREELEFYPHGTGPDLQTATFTKVKEHIILKIQSELLNGSDIEE